MPFLSAADDFFSRTLATLEGGTKKLVYVASLRQRDGSYRHWGLERTHGPDAAEQAIIKTHSRTWIEMLRTPVPELVAELETMDAADREDVLAKLSASAIPAQQCGGSVSHFNSTVLFLQLAFQPQSERRAA